MICVSDRVFRLCYGFLSPGVTGRRAQLIIQNRPPLFNCQCQTSSFSSETCSVPFFLTRLQGTCTGLGTRLVHEHLPYKTGLDVMRSHLLRRMCFGQYQASIDHQLRWGDREKGIAISCIECSQVAGLIQKSVDTPRKHCVHAQLL